MSRLPGSHGEPVLPLPAPRDRVPPARTWRSTWVISSIAALKKRGHFDAYAARLPREHADSILLAVAGQWLPVEVAAVHYRTCDALGLPEAEQLELGLAVGDRTQGSVLRTAVALARTAGVSPWTMFEQAQRFWERGSEGGALASYKVGPKEAILEGAACALFDIPYFRTAFGGVVLGVLRLVCARAYVHFLPPPCKGGALFRYQWA